MGRRAHAAHPSHRWDRYTAPVGADTEGASGSGLLTGEHDPELAEDLGRAAPEGRSHRMRWSLSARLASAVVGLLAVCAGLWWWSVAVQRPSVEPADRPDSETPADARIGLGPGVPTGGTADDGARRVVVHVAGAVAAPGVYRLPEGARVHEAIEAAGGPVSGAEPGLLNLAAEIGDGTRVVVPRVGEPVEQPGPANLVPSGAGPPSGSSTRSSKVNVNRAGADELAGLPRVGPVLAQRIVDYRSEHGPFASVDALDAVPGIGPRMLDALRPQVTV